VIRIKINHDKCTGCRLCELICSLHHMEGIFNPKKARIAVFSEEHIYYPVIAGPYTDAECNSRNVVVVREREFDGCALCRASCPAKPVFKEPDTEIPLKCDFCGEPPDPQCVKVCVQGALTLVEDESDVLAADCTLGTPESRTG
jgi:Fe-S-cluster-containing hydrogenase component 2